MRIPESVNGNKITELTVLYECDSYAIATFRYQGIPQIAFRWNGNERAEDLGTPTAFGKPIWMFLPEDFLAHLKAVWDKKIKD